VVRVRTPTEVLDSLFAHAVQEELLTSSTFRRGRFGIIFAILASEIANWEEYLSYIIKECYLQSASEDQNIEKLAAPLRYRFPSRPSRTLLTFYWTIPYEQRTTDVTIPYLQIAETEGTDPIQYLVTEEKTLYKEQEYIKVRAQSRLTGKDTKVNAEELCVCEPRLNGISSLNEEASWGGTDQESIEELRENALITRYSLEKGTKSTLEGVLRENGLYSGDYNLVENNHGYGNFSVYIDTTVEEQIQEIKVELSRIKAAGIYMTCQVATPLYLNLNFEVKISNPADLLPTERKILKQDLEQNFTEFVKNNGVGQKIMMSRAIHYLYEKLLSKYEIFDININATELISQKDEDGNILLEEYEVAKIKTINTEIITDLK
jgi:hypothetical protein